MFQHVNGVQILIKQGTSDSLVFNGIFIISVVTKVPIKLTK